MTKRSLIMRYHRTCTNGKIEGAARKVPNRRDRRKLATRQALLDATHALLASRSIDALSVDEIAMRADVAKGTFYNYFADKDALERELASHVRARLEDEIARANEGVDDPAERIARAFCCVLRLGLGDARAGHRDDEALSARDRSRGAASTRECAATLPTASLKAVSSRRRKMSRSPASWACSWPE